MFLFFMARQNDAVLPSSDDERFNKLPDHKYPIFTYKPMPEQRPSPNEQIKTVTSRISFVEQRYRNFETRLKQLQKNIVDQQQETRRLLRDLEKRSLKFDTQLEGFTDRLKALRNEIILRASKEDVAVLKKYIDIWNPFEFVTADQVEQLVRDLNRPSEEVRHSPPPPSDAAARQRTSRFE
jgi:septal ring factor EnvC (AmiA/AmiB activator)